MHLFVSMRADKAAATAVACVEETGDGEFIDQLAKTAGCRNKHEFMINHVAYAFTLDVRAMESASGVS